MHAWGSYVSVITWFVQIKVEECSVCYMRMRICYVSFCNHCMSFYHVVILILISAVRCVSSIKRVLFSTKGDSTQPVAAFTNTTVMKELLVLP